MKFGKLVISFLINSIISVSLTKTPCTTENCGSSVEENEMIQIKNSDAPNKETKDLVPDEDKQNLYTKDEESQKSEESNPTQIEEDCDESSEDLITFEELDTMFPYTNPEISCSISYPTIIVESLESLQKKICDLAMNLLAELKQVTTDLCNSISNKIRDIRPDYLTTGLNEIFEQLKNDEPNFMEKTADEISNTLNSGYQTIVTKLQDIFVSELTTISNKIQGMGVDELREYFQDDIISKAVNSATSNSNNYIHMSLNAPFSDVQKIYANSISSENVIKYNGLFDTLKKNIDKSFKNAISESIKENTPEVDRMLEKIATVIREKREEYDDTMKSINTRIYTYIFG